MMPHAARIPLTIAAITLAGVSATPVALAQDASAWDADGHAAARLIAGPAQQSAGSAWLHAGVEMKLDPGWKTYWRYPGDSGVPPTLDFAGSRNVKSITVLWPAPEQFADGAGGHSIGYQGDVVLPLRIAADDPALPSLLHLKLAYAVCANLCIPAEANLDLALPGDGSEAPALAAAEARVPRRLALGEGAGLAIRSVHRLSGGAREHVVVEVAAPDDTPVTLFVEGPSAEWALPLPEPTGAATAAPRTRLFAFDLDGLPPGAQAKGAALTLTAVTPADAIEVATHLD